MKFYLESGIFTKNSKGSASCIVKAFEGENFWDLLVSLKIYRKLLYCTTKRSYSLLPVEVRI